MEQEQVFDLGNFDERNISLDETPRDALHYLQQVAVSRSRCPEVVTAKMIPQKGTPSAWSKEFMFNCEPPSEWSLAQDVKHFFLSSNFFSKFLEESNPDSVAVQKSDRFSMQRSFVEDQRSHCKKITNFRWPSLKEPDGWHIFCLEKRNDEIPLEPKDIPRFAHHRGNPPTLRLVLSLSEKQINIVIKYLIQFFVDDGYTRALSEWIYALLLVLQKPLLHGVCAAIRELAKHSRLLRSTLENEKSQVDGPTSEEFSLFIAIVGVYFEQKDLADQISSPSS